VTKAKQRNNSHIVKVILILFTILLALLLIFVPVAKAPYSTSYTPSNFKILSIENSKLEIYFPIKENKTKEKNNNSLYFTRSYKY